VIEMVGRVVSVVLGHIALNPLYCSNIYSQYVLIMLLCLILVQYFVMEVFSMINCKGFSRGWCSCTPISL
jgi:uncharacterized membrane protein YcaP (DUF421 family)